MLRVLHSESREECIKFVESIFNNPNPIIINTIKSKSPKSVIINWNNILCKGIISFCYYNSSKMDNNFNYITVPFSNEEIYNVS